MKHQEYILNMDVKKYQQRMRKMKTGRVGEFGGYIIGNKNYDKQILEGKQKTLDDIETQGFKMGFTSGFIGAMVILGVVVWIISLVG